MFLAGAGAGTAEYCLTALLSMLLDWNVDGQLKETLLVDTKAIRLRTSIQWFGQR